MDAPAKTRPIFQPSSDPQVDQGPLYKVIIHNDDVTPMDFVIRILLRVFFVSGPAAVQIMFAAHHNGSAYVQTLPKAEAQERVNRAHFAAAAAGYPLRFTLEPE